MPENYKVWQKVTEKRPRIFLQLFKGENVKLFVFSKIFFILEIPKKYLALMVLLLLRLSKAA
jgi:hypothetical protein